MLLGFASSDAEFWRVYDTFTCYWQEFVAKNGASILSLFHWAKIFQRLSNSASTLQPPSRMLSDFCEVSNSPRPFCWRAALVWARQALSWRLAWGRSSCSWRWPRGIQMVGLSSRGRYLHCLLTWMFDVIWCSLLNLLLWILQRHRLEKCFI